MMNTKTLRLIALCCAATLAAFVVGCGRGHRYDGKQAGIDFDTYFMNKGEFPIDSVMTYTYTFTNTGEAPLQIEGLSYSCSCMSGTFPKKAIKPGKTGQLVVTYDPAHQPLGHFKKFVVIHSNTDMVRVFVEGVVTR